MPEIETPQPRQQTQESPERPEPIKVETAAATAALNEISTKPSKDPLQEAVQKGDFAWLSNAMPKPGEVGTADFFLSHAREMHGEKPHSSLSQGEIAARQMAGLFRTADMGIANRNQHILGQTALADGRALYTYDSAKRPDNLKTAAVRQGHDLLETEKRFQGRNDGLDMEKLFVGSKKQIIERTYDPTKNRENLSTFKSVKEGDKLTISAEFLGRADGLVKENLTADKNGQLRIKEYADGRREEVTTGKDGKSESKFFDASGKPLTGEKFQEGQKALEAKIKAEKAAQPAKAPEGQTEKLPGEGITLPPLKAGWGPYQALQQLQREGRINLTPAEMKKEAERIRDREFAERGVGSFKQGEKIKFYSQKELKERGRGGEQPQKGQEASREKPLERQTNIEQRLSDIKKALDPSTPMTPENADALRRQFSDLTPAEIQRLKAGFDKDNPNALGDAIKDKFSKMDGGLDRHAHRWAEVEGHLNRTGQPGEDRAIKLRVDALEARWAGYDNNRSFAAIQENTRTTLLGLTEEQRTQMDSSLSKLYGKGGLSELYEKGPGKDLKYTGNHWYNGEDKFTKSVIDLATKKGVDARTPEEQASLLHAALQTRDVNRFREVAGKDVMTAAGRKHFLENGGLDKINEKRSAGRGVAQDVFTEIQRRELTDLAKTGEESPITQMKKAIGVFSNTESSLAAGVQRIAETPKLREAYLNGRELSLTKREPKTEQEKQALEFYNEAQKTFKSAYYFGSERKAQNFDSQIVNGPNGALSNGKLFDLGASNWQHRSDLFKAIEGATPEQLNGLFDGARIVDGKPQSDGLADGRKALSLGINRETNRAGLEALLEKKVAYGVELGQIADKIKDTPRGTPIDGKTLQDLRDKVPAFKGLSLEKMQQVVEGFRLDQAVKSNELNPKRLSKQEQQQLSSYQNMDAEKNPQESALKGFLQGRETQRNIDKMLNAPDQLAGTRASNVSEYMKTLKPEEARSLEMFRSIRNDAVQTNVKRDLKDAIGDAKDQQSFIAALKGATPAEQERLKTPEYQKEIRDLAERTATNPASRLAAQMILDGYAQGKPLSKAEGATVNALERVSNGDQNIFDKQKAVIDSLKTALRDDKDGSLAKELMTNEQLKRALGEAIGGDRKFNTVVEPLLKTGMVPVDQMKRIYGNGGPELFKAGVLEATPQGLKHLNSPEGQKDREALLKDMTPEARALSEKIIKQGEVKPEDRMRAVAVGYEKPETAVEYLKTTAVQQRVDTVRAYSKAFGSNLQEDLLKKASETDKPFVTLLATENQLTGEQSLIRSREAVTNTASTWLGGQALKYDSSIYRNLSDLALADRQYKGQIPPDVMDKRIKDLAANLKSFEGTKEELANQIVEGVVTVAAIGATPFTGGASLSALMLTARFAALSAGGGLTGSLLKAQLTGNYEHLAGDLVKFTALTGANLLGGEALTAFSGLGTRAAAKTVEKTFAQPALEGALKGASPAVREQLEKGLADLIQKGYTAGGVKDDAVRALVGGLQGLSRETQEALSKGLIDNLSKGLREVSTEGLRGSVEKLSRFGRTAGLDGSAAYIGDVGGELARQAQQGKLDIGHAIVGGVNSFFLGTGARGTIESFKALKAARQAQRGGTEIVELGKGEVGPAFKPRGAKDNVVDLSPSEYQWIDEPAGHLEAPRKALAPVERLKPGDKGYPHAYVLLDDAGRPLGHVAAPENVKALPREVARFHTAPHTWTAPVDAVEPPVKPGYTRLYRGVKEEGLGTEFTPPMTKEERKLFDKMMLGDIPRDQWSKEQEAFFKRVSDTRAFQNGRYFSDNIETAKDYAGTKGKVIYVDVPAEYALRHSKSAGALPGKDGANFNATVFEIKSEISLTAREHALSPTNAYRLAEKAEAEVPHARLVGRPASLDRAADVPQVRVTKPPTLEKAATESAADVHVPKMFDGVPQGHAENIPKLNKHDLERVAYESAGVKLRLEKRGSFFYPEGTNVRIEDVSELKIHVGAQDAADLQKLQAVLIPYLSGNKELKGLVQEWKTLKPGEPAIRESNRNKAFTIYADSPEKLEKIRQTVDKIIVQHGLGLDQPISSTIGDLVRSQSNRIGEARDIWNKGFAVVDGKVSPAALVDDNVVQAARAKFGVAGTDRLSSQQIAKLEADAGVRKGALVYDDSGRLAVRLSSNGSGPDVRGVYAAENPTFKDSKPKDAADRNALYALYRHLEVEPVVTPKAKGVQATEKPKGIWNPRETNVGLDHLREGQDMLFGSTFKLQDAAKNPHVDSIHATFGLDADGAFVIDSSKNGTYFVRNIDGKLVVDRIEPGFKFYIPQGAEVWLGHPSQGYRLPLKNQLVEDTPPTVPLHVTNRT